MGVVARLSAAPPPPVRPQVTEGAAHSAARHVPSLSSLCSLGNPRGQRAAARGSGSPRRFLFWWLPGHPSTFAWHQDRSHPCPCPSVPAHPSHLGPDYSRSHLVTNSPKNHSTDFQVQPHTGCLIEARFYKQTNQVLSVFYQELRGSQAPVAPGSHHTACSRADSVFRNSPTH